VAECWVSRVASCWQRGAISTADTDEADFRLPASEDRLWVDSCLIGGFVMNGSYLWSTARKLTGGKRPNSGPKTRSAADARFQDRPKIVGTAATWV
jgi:hypothetical protein|tara:strand:- start:1790 stop:2077 length:288 start_codon:yes stop_codon:yes gene_type:complete